jgi:hypothetical protein
MMMKNNYSNKYYIVQFSNEETKQKLIKLS